MAASQRVAERELKLCLLGAAQAGKSSLVLRFVSDVFSASSTATIGASFLSKTLVVDDVNFKFQIWDTAGQEKFRGLAALYYRGAAAAILVYDITDRKSFTALKDWRSELTNNGPEQVTIAVVGNKLDLEEHRQIMTDEGQDYAKEIGAIFLETSARTAHNVQLLFETIARALPKLPVVVAPSNNVNLDDKNANQKKCC